MQLQASAFFERLTAREQIHTFAALYRAPSSAADEWLERVGLEEKTDTRVEDLSGGQAQRLSIACALVHDPELVFLDEPTAALDPQARRNLWDLLTDINEAGRTVVLTTHYMDEAETLCDRVAIVDHGRLLQHDTPASLVALARQRRQSRGRVPRAHRQGVPGMRNALGSPFGALSLAILRGFVRDRTALFFAVIFPLMFLVLFGALLSNQDQSEIDMITVGDVPLLDDLPPDAQDAFDTTFDIEKSDDLGAALAKVRKGDADVVVEQRGDTLVAHYTQTEQVKAAITQGTLRAYVDGANVAATGQPPRFGFEAERVEDDSLTTIQFFTPGLLGWAIATSSAFGAAATLQGWRQTKMLRRLQLAPVSTGTIVGARVAVTVAIALGQTAIFLGLGAAALGLTLNGSWWMSIPLVVVGTLCFMAIGLLAGAIAKSTEGAVNMANFFVLPMAFLSGSFFPLDAAPTWLRRLSDLLPLKHLNEAMLDVLVRGQGPSSALLPLAILAAFAVVVTLLAARLFRWDTA